MESAKEISDTDGLTITTDCETVDDFFAALSPRNSSYVSMFPRCWIFRGHADDRFELLPAALRNSSRDLGDLARLPTANTNSELLRIEKRVILDFLRISDSVGLNVPEDTQKLRRLLEEKRQADCWPPDEALSLIALAQHHGVPTRLLDWSRHPLKAAWFAASGASKIEDKSGRLSVWALSIDKLDMVNDNRPFTIVTAPSASNSNLRAQEGVFTVADRILADENPVNRTPFDEILRQWVKRCDVRSPGPWFHKITLPQSCAEQLCFDLALEGINQATLFPDFYGVVNAMRDMARWYNNLGSPGCNRMDKYSAYFSVQYTKEVPWQELLNTHPAIKNLLHRRQNPE